MKNTKNLSLIVVFILLVVNIKAQDVLPSMVTVPGGTFIMGVKNAKSHQMPSHSVTLSSFKMSKYEITYDQYKYFITSTNYITDIEKNNRTGYYYGGWQPADKDKKINWKYDVFGEYINGKSNHPVVHVSWNDANAYCKWLSSKTGQTYRLPTEAEWEYAARGGSSQTKYFGTNNKNETSSYDWFYENSNEKPHAVGKKKPNKYGLYDMGGNVWEWCNDWDIEWDGKHSTKPQTNPTGPSTGSSRVHRGSCWLDNVYAITSRNIESPVVGFGCLGFRVVAVINASSVGVNNENMGKKNGNIANFTKSYEGKINNKYGIVMTLTNKNNLLSGTYSYKSSKIPMKIAGNIDQNGKLTIKEYNKKAKITGIFKGKLSGISISGNWQTPDGSKIMPFSISEASNIVSDKVTCTEDDSKVDDGGNPITIKTCLYKNFKMVRTEYSGTKFSYYEHAMYAKQANGNYVQITNSQLFNNKRNELLAILNAKIKKLHKKLLNGSESGDCFYSDKLKYYKYDDFSIEFVKDAIIFKGSFGLSAYCKFCDDFDFVFSLAELQKYLTKN